MISELIEVSCIDFVFLFHIAGDYLANGINTNKNQMPNLIGVAEEVLAASLSAGIDFQRVNGALTNIATPEPLHAQLSNPVVTNR